ncbi:MAG: phenylacetate--CoA ligase family protein [Terriglobales bacterium]
MNGTQRRRISERLAGGVVFPLWARRTHAGYAPWRAQFEQSQYWDAGKLGAWQQQQLGRLLAHAARHCRFYHERFARAGVDLGQPLAGWTHLPLLTKADLQNHGPALEADNYGEHERERNQTGGSTGTPLQFYVDRARWDSRLASTWRHNAWAGLAPGDWVAQVWGHRLDLAGDHGWPERWKQRLLYRTLDLNSAHVAPGDWEAYLARLRRVRPRYLLAYARAAVQLAEYVRAQGVHDIRFAAIITSAEVLEPAHRALLEEVFAAPVFNRYGCREVSVIASECSAHRGLHVNAEALLVEIVPAEGLDQPWGKVVITDLLNYAQPLIRYEIGDVGCWAEGPCPCGRKLPRLEAIAGRTTDFLQLPDGAVVSGPALTLVVADMGSVRQVQFVQQASGAVRLRVIAGAGYGADTEEELRRRLRVYLGDSLELRIEPVAAIASEASGKYRFVVQEQGGQAHA